MFALILRLSAMEVPVVFPPYTAFDLITDRTPKDVIDAISSSVEPRRPAMPMLYGGGKQLSGCIDQNHFRGRRIPKSRNRYLPTIDALVEGYQNGSKVRVKMYDLTIILGFLVAGIFFMVRGGGAPTIVVVLVAIYVLLFTFFNVEVNRAKRILESIVRTP